MDKSESDFNQITDVWLQNLLISGGGFIHSCLVSVTLQSLCSFCSANMQLQCIRSQWHT